MWGTGRQKLSLGKGLEKKLGKMWGKGCPPLDKEKLPPKYSLSAKNKEERMGGKKKGTTLKRVELFGSAKKLKRET